MIKATHPKEKPPVFPGVSPVCKPLKQTDMDDTGPEIVAKTKGFQQFSGKGGAESGAVDDDLAKILAVWPQLTEQEKTQISEFVARLRSSPPL